MMIEDRLKTLSAADAPAARDLAFEIAVLARIERRRFHRMVTRNLLLTLAAIPVLALAMPGLRALWQAGFATSQALLPGLSVNLMVGMGLTAASLALPWWRRAG